MAEGGIGSSPAAELMSGLVPEQYQETPIQALLLSTRHEICLHLNIQATVRMNDWRMVAERLGCRTIEIDNWMMKDNPMEAVLHHAMRGDIKLGELLKVLQDIERLDVLQATARMIESDVKNYKPLQDRTVQSSDDRLEITIGELNTGAVEYFDAFVAHHPLDMRFVQEELLRRMEDEQGFKLCVPDRDLIIGTTQNEAITTLITERCKRVIIVLSKAFVDAEGYEGPNRKWQMIFAQAYAPISQKMHKLVPVVIEHETPVPNVLIPYNASDYSREATRQWFWNRLVASLDAPVLRQYEGRTGYKGPRPRLGRDIHASSRQTSRQTSRQSSRQTSRQPRASTAPIELPSNQDDTANHSDSPSASPGSSSQSSSKSSSLLESSEFSNSMTSIGNEAASGPNSFAPVQPLTTTEPPPRKSKWPFNNNNNNNNNGNRK